MAQNEVRYKFTAEDSQFKKVAGNVTGELKKMAKDGTLGVAALSTAFYALGRSMQDTLNTMDQISKMSSKTGFSTESLSALKYAADLSGVSLESLEKSLIKLNKAIASNSPAFRDLGIEIKKTDGTLKDGETILMEMSDAFNKMEDGAIKTAKSTDLMGKSGADMIPLLNGGKDSLTAMMEEARKAGATFDEISAKQAERFNDAITKLEYTAKGFTQELITALMPAIDDLSTGMETVSNKSTKLIDNISPLEVVARGIAMGFYIAGSSILWVYQVIRTVGTAIAEYYQFIGKGLTGIAAFAQGNYPLAMSIFSNMGDTAFSNLGKEIDALLARAGEIYNTILNIGTGTVIPKSAGAMTDDEFWANRANDPKYAKEYAEYLKRKKDGGSGGNNVPKSSSAKNSEIDELKTFEQAKIDALKDLELAWSDWQIENEKATLDEKLRAEREYLQRRLTLLLQYKGSDAFGNLTVSEQTSTNNEIINLNTGIEKLTDEIKKLDIDTSKKLVESGVKKVDADKDILQKMLGGKQFIIDYKDWLYQHKEFMNVDNPPYATNDLDQIGNQKTAEGVKFLREAGYSVDDPMYIQDVIGNLEKKYYEYQKQIYDALKSGIIAQEDADIFNTQLEANKIVERERLEKNHAEYLVELERQTWEIKTSIVSDALSSIGKLFQKHTLAYQALMSAQVIIDTYSAATKALLLPPPWGEIQMAAIIAQGLGNLQQIWSVDIPAFAKGGLITSPTLGLLGENGAEFIAPQKDFVSYTKQIIRSVENQKATTGFVGNLKLRGNDLVVAVERASQMRGRLGT